MNITKDLKTTVAADPDFFDKVIRTELRLYIQSRLSRAVTANYPQSVHHIARQQEQGFIRELFGPLREVVEELTHLAMKGNEWGDHNRIMQLRGKAMEHMALDIKVDVPEENRCRF